MNLADFDFRNLNGLGEYQWQTPLNFVGTGMASGYDMARMSTSDQRRDWGAGVSGSHLAAEPGTCFSELKLNAPYPDDSYRITFTGSLKLLDLRNVDSAAFSGAYYSHDRSTSCQILDYNKAYLAEHGYDGILRFSQPLLAGGQYSEVVAISPVAIGKLGIQDVYGLGNATTQFTIKLPDGRSYCPSVIR